MKTEYLFIRRLPLHYAAPPVCENDFTGTGEPSISLATHRRYKVTGLFVQTTSTGFRLNWNTVDGGLCYNVYSLQGETWVLIGECIQDNFFDVGPGVYSVTVITREGESEMSDPINTSEETGPAVVMTVVADVPETYEISDEPGTFRFIRNGPLAGNFFARFVLSGTATFGASDDYSLTATTTLNHVGGATWEIFMPDSVAEVFMYVEGHFDGTAESDETVVVSLQPTSNYAVGSPDVATVTIKEGCVPETGTDTPCDLGVDEETFIGNLTITPTHYATTESASWGVMSPGMYEARYAGGAYKFDGNPDPGAYRIQGYHVRWPDGGTNYWDQFGNCNDSSEAAVEACVPVGLAFSDVANNEAINLEFDNGGPASDYSGGSSPQFALYRVKTYPTMPNQIRIREFDESEFDQCPDFVASGATPWSGTFPNANIEFPSTIFWNEPNPTNFSFNGQELTFARVDYFSSHPTNGTGCGWRVFLEVGKNSAPFFTASWVGFKGVGTTPVGIYYRASGCSTGPTCLVIEEY